MPSKAEIIEDFLAQIEERFHQILKGDTYPNFFGGRVEICYSAKPRLEITIREIGKTGPKPGTKFKKNPSLQAARRLHKQESYGNDANDTGI